MNLVDQNADDVVIQLSKRELQLVVSLIQQSLVEAAQNSSENQNVNDGFIKIARMVRGLAPSHLLH